MRNLDLKTKEFKNLKFIEHFLLFQQNMKIYEYYQISGFLKIIQMIWVLSSARTLN